MTLYDITLTHEDTPDNEGLSFPSRTLNKRLTVTVTPYRPLIVPPGSTLVINREDGPEAVLTGDGVHLVHRGDSFYTNTRIIDGYVLVQLQQDAHEYLARAGEDLIVESIRAIAEATVKEATS